MPPLQANMEKLCLEGNTAEVSKYSSGSKIKARSSHGWLLFSSSSISAVSLNSAKTYLPPPIFHIENIWVLRMSEWQRGTGGD